MIDQFLRPKIVFLVGLSSIALSLVYDTFLSSPFLWAAESIGYPLASQFTQALVQGIAMLSWTARLLGPALIAASLVLLKLDRMSAAGAIRPVQNDATPDSAHH